MAYEYANRLTTRGHTVTLVHPWRTGPVSQSLRERVHRMRTHFGARRGVPWFRLNEGVRYELVPSLDPGRFPDGDAIVATGWRTADPVSRAHPSKGAGLYLIQSYEIWDGQKERVDATWRLPLHKVVIASWLEELSAGFGESERTTVIPNGIDFDDFYVTTPIERRPKRVGMIWHHWEIKGMPEGIEALRRAQTRFPGLEIVLFGTRRAPRSLPIRATYLRSPTGGALRDLYNTCAIFLHTSRSEGWALPPAEAMACGCALVAAANEGVREYTLDGQNALHAPVGDAEALAHHLVSLLEDGRRREQLARSGHESIQAFTWDRAVDRFEQVLAQRSSRAAT